MWGVARRVATRPLLRNTGSPCCSTESSSEVPVFFPQLRPRKAWLPAHENVGMVLALLVFYPERVPVVTGEPAPCEDFVRFLLRDAKSNDGGGLRCRVAAQPRRVCRADGRRQVVSRSKHLDRPLLAIVSHRDSKIGLLVRWQRIANA